MIKELKRKSIKKTEENIGDYEFDLWIGDEGILGEREEHF